MTLSGIAAIAALLGLGVTGVHGAGSIAQRSNIKDAYNYYTQLKNDAGLQDIDTKDIISRLKTDGKLTESEYKLLYASKESTYCLTSEVFRLADKLDKYVPSLLYCCSARYGLLASSAFFASPKLFIDCSIP